MRSKLKQHFFTIIGVLIIAGMAFWLSDVGSRRSNLPQLEISQPLYYMNDFTLTAYNAAGAVKHELAAKRIGYYVDQHSQIEQPRLAIFEKTARWDLNATEGQYNQNEQIDLKNGVHIIQTPFQKDRDRITVDTDHVKIDLLAGIAETESPVKLQSDRGWVEAQSMQLWFNEKQLFLHNRVRGYYHVNK